MSITDSLNEVVHDFVYSNPMYYPLCIDYYRKTMQDYFMFEEGNDSDISYKDLFLQSYHPGDYVVNGFAIFRLHTWLCSDQADIIPVKIGEIPTHDNAIQSNKEKLMLLKSPFAADFWGGLTDYDGIIMWDTEDLNAPNNTIDAFKNLSEVPLEVGYCDPKTLLWHLNIGRAFARWPYGSDWLYIYAIREQAWQQWKSEVKYISYD